MPRTLQSTFTHFGRKSGSAFQHGTTSSTSNGGLQRGRQLSKYGVGGLTARSERGKIHRTEVSQVSKGSLTKESTRPLLTKVKEIKRMKDFIHFTRPIPICKSISRTEEKVLNLDKVLPEVLSSNQFVDRGNS